MYCPNCGTKVADIGNFCDSCGHSLKKSTKDTPDLSKENPKLESANVLWKKFLEIVRAEGNEAKKYNELTSDAAWEMIGRFYNNSFNDLVENYKIDLDRQPYKAIEAIKLHLTSFVNNAYQVFMAEQLLKEGKFEKAEIKAVEELAEEWKRVFRNYTNKIISIPEDALAVLNNIDEQISEGLFEANSTLKELPKAVVDGIKESLVQQLLYGYLLGVAENNLRNDKK